MHVNLQDHSEIDSDMQSAMVMTMFRQSDVIIPVVWTAEPINIENVIAPSLGDRPRCSLTLIGKTVIPQPLLLSPVASPTEKFTL